MYKGSRSYLNSDEGADVAIIAIALTGLILCAAAAFLTRPVTTYESQWRAVSVSGVAATSQPGLSALGAAVSPGDAILWAGGPFVANVHYSQPGLRYARGSGGVDAASVVTLRLNELRLNPLVLGTMPTFAILGTAYLPTLEGEAGNSSN